MLRIRHAETTADIDTVRVLFLEYQMLLGVDLSFQGFDIEVERLPGDYSPPTGRLLLATHSGMPVGCVALHAVNEMRCEMKRLFVRPSARGLKVGKTLIERVIEEARLIGYSEIVLDTLPNMIDAQRLYSQFGFSDIAPYRPNPIPGTRYLGKCLID